jgi:hypothetical protein
LPLFLRLRTSRCNVKLSMKALEPT